MSMNHLSDTDAMTGRSYRVNPRVGNYLRATGRTLRNWKAWEFALWNRARLREAIYDIPHAFYIGLLVNHDAYDTWLDKRVNDILTGVR